MDLTLHVKGDSKALGLSKIDLSFTKMRESVKRGPLEGENSVYILTL